MYKNINLDEFQDFPTYLKDNWALITAGTKDNYNTMTINWGTIGYLWRKNVFFAFVRPTRHTFNFTESNDYFTISFYNKKYLEQLGYLGKISGRDEDKVKAVNFHPIEVNNSIAFEEAEVILVCKKIYSDFLKENKFIDKQIITDCYHNDYHKIYVGEIIEVLKK